MSQLLSDYFMLGLEGKYCQGELLILQIFIYRYLTAD